jgi:hypothetical protein
MATTATPAFHAGPRWSDRVIDQRSRWSRQLLELAESVGAVDLVRWEAAPPELRALVTRYGLPVLDP